LPRSGSIATRAKVEMIFTPALTEPAKAAPIGDRHFQHAQARTRHPHLHFQIPTIGELAHAEPEQRVAADGTERAHVGIAHAVEQPRQNTGDAAGDKLVPGHAARLARAAGARSNDEVIGAGADRRDQARDGGRIVGAVAVHEDDDVAGKRCLRAFETGQAIAATDRDDLGARATCFLRSAVAAAAIGHDDASDDVARDLRDDGRDRFRFVECGNDDDDTARGRGRAVGDR
jgi:hypothetical protein